MFYILHTLISFKLVVGILMLSWQSAKVYGIELISVNKCSLIAKWKSCVALPASHHRWGRSPSFQTHYKFYYILMFQIIQEEFLTSAS